MRLIDLRSDTVTRPTGEMRAAMAAAEVGDDVYGEDPTVNRLQTLAASMAGMEAALFLCSGTQSNLVALMSHCQRGDEYIVGQDAHTFRFEAGGAAVLGSIQPQPLDFEADGTLDLQRVARACKPDDPHFARTRLLCLENTQGGKVLPLDYLESARDLARQRGLALHLDGARVCNAAVALGVPVAAITRHFDSVSICLSKGLGAPVGSVLCGSEAFIRCARRQRKIVGGGMRQAGILAAAGVIALEQHVDRLREDHANARLLAAGLAEVDEVTVDPQAVQTNMVFATIGDTVRAALAEHLEVRGIRIRRDNPVRLVTHLDVTADDMRAVVAAVKAFFAGRAPG